MDREGVVEMRGPSMKEKEELASVGGSGRNQGDKSSNHVMLLGYHCLSSATCSNCPCVYVMSTPQSRLRKKTDISKTQVTRR